MKKIIALAVAAAAMPAMAAVSISGTTEVSYSKTDASKTLSTEKVALNVAASGELDNGMTVSTGITLWNAGNALNNDGGEGSITLSGSFGSLSVGDVAGPLDALDGVAVATPENDLSNGQGADMAVRYDFPTFVEGLTLHAGMAPKNGGDTGVMTDGSGFGASYSVAGFKVFAGTESFKTVAADTDTTGYGVKYGMSGFTVGYNTSEKDVTGGDKTEMAGYSAGYATGNFAVAINTSETEVNSAVTSDKSSIGASYNLGGGVKVYAVTTKDDKVAASDEDTVGISFSF